MSSFDLYKATYSHVQLATITYIWEIKIIDRGNDKILHPLSVWIKGSSKKNAIRWSFKNFVTVLTPLQKKFFSQIYCAPVCL